MDPVASSLKALESAVHRIWSQLPNNHLPMSHRIDEVLKNILDEIERDIKQMDPVWRFGVNDSKSPQYGLIQFMSEIEIHSQFKNSYLIDYLSPVPFQGTRSIIPKNTKSMEILRFPGFSGKKP
ncbi:hypothetical protein TNCV_3526801 [Trichonephila clavipes]|nr:hypothetical protein TNCV_3526801 [Trichonephila clavipes]